MKKQQKKQQKGSMKLLIMLRESNNHQVEIHQQLSKYIDVETKRRKLKIRKQLQAIEKLKEIQNY